MPASSTSPTSPPPRDRSRASRSPEAQQAVTNYPIAVVKNAPQAGLAQKWIDMVTGEFGQKTLDAAGFGAEK